MEWKWAWKAALLRRLYMRGVAQEASELAAKMGWGRGRKRSWGEAARGLILPRMCFHSGRNLKPHCTGCLTQIPLPCTPNQL